MNFLNSLLKPIKNPTRCKEMKKGAIPTTGLITNQLKQKNMKKTVNKKNIGKKCQCYMLGEKTKGIITAIEGESIKITFDTPIIWGSEVFEYGWFSGTQLKYITINK